MTLNKRTFPLAEHARSPRGARRVCPLCVQKATWRHSPVMSTLLFRTMLYGECAARSDGFEPSGITPAEFGAYIKAEIAKWRRVIEQANMDKI